MISIGIIRLKLNHKALQLSGKDKITSDVHLNAPCKHFLQYNVHINMPSLMESSLTTSR